MPKCNPQDVISELEKKKEILLNNLSKGSKGFAWSNILSGGFVSGIVNDLENALGGIIPGLIDNILEKSGGGDVIRTIMSLYTTVTTLFEHAKLFYYGMYVESLKQTLINRMSVSKKLDTEIRNIIYFLQNWGYKASTEQWDKMNKVFPHVKRADSMMKRTKDELENSGRILVHAYKISHREIETAETEYQNSNIDLNNPNVGKEILQSLKAKYDKQVSNFELYLSAVLELAKIVPLGAEVISGAGMEISDLLAYFAGAAVVLPVNVAVGAEVENKTLSEIGKDFLSDLGKIPLQYLTGETLISSNTIIRSNVEEIRNFDANYEEMLKNNKNFVKKIIDKLHDLLEALKGNMEADLKGKKSANTKLAAKNTLYHTQITMLRTLFESVGNQVLERAKMQEMYVSLNTLEEMLRSYPEEHNLEKVVELLPGTFSSSLEGLWEEYGTQKAIVELNTIRRHIQKGIAMDERLYRECDKFDVMELPLITFIKGSLPYLEQLKKLKKEKKAFDEFMKKYTEIIGVAVPATLNSLTNVFSMTGVTKYLGYSFDEVEQCAKSLNVFKFSKPDPAKHFESSALTMKAATDADINTVGNELDTKRSWYSGKEEAFREAVA